MLTWLITTVLFLTAALLFLVVQKNRTFRGSPAYLRKIAGASLVSAVLVLSLAGCGTPVEEPDPTTQLEDLVVSIQPNPITPEVEGETLVWQFAIQVFNPNQQDVELIAFGEGDECSRDHSACAYSASDFSELFADCGSGSSIIPAGGKACAENFRFEVPAAEVSEEFSRTFTFYFKDELGEIQKTTSRLIQFSLPPVPPTASPTPEPGPEPTYLIIEDSAFVDYQGECATEATILNVTESGLEASGTLSLRDGEWVLFCPGAVHTWSGTLTYAGYTFSSAVDDPLVFTVNAENGYEYLRGSGTVTLPDGTTYELSSAAGTAGAAVNPVEEPDYDRSYNWDFESPTEDWFTGEEGYQGSLAQVSIEDGVYRISAESNQEYIGFYYLAEVDPVRDFEFSVEAEMTSGTESSTYGLVFRWNENEDMYILMVSPQMGSFALWRLTAGEPNNIADWTHCEAINLGRKNTLSVRFWDNVMRLYINGEELLIDITDEEFTVGQVGVRVDLFEVGAQAQVQFDNIELKGN